MKIGIEIIQQMAILENNLRNAISNLPDNPKIIRQSKTCFIIGAKDLSPENWTPEYYDFKIQYKKIVELIGRTPVHKIDDVLVKLAKTGVIGHTNYHNRITLNPAVVKSLKRILKKKCKT